MIFKSKGQFADDAIDVMKKADTAKVTVLILLKMLR